MRPPLFEVVRDVLDGFFANRAGPAAIERDVGHAIRRAAVDMVDARTKSTRFGYIGDVYRAAHLFVHAAIRADLMRTHLLASDALHARLDDGADLAVAATGCGAGAELLGFLAYVIDSDRHFPEMRCHHLTPDAWRPLASRLLADHAALVPAAIVPVVDDLPESIVSHPNLRNADVFIAAFANTSSQGSGRTVLLPGHDMRTGALFVVLDHPEPACRAGWVRRMQAAGFATLSERHSIAESGRNVRALDEYSARLGRRPLASAETYFGLFEKR